MTVGKMIGGLWFMLLGISMLIIYGLLFTSKVEKSVPSTFVCAPSSIEEKVKQASIIVRGRVDGVLAGQPYADVWVAPTQWLKGQPTKFVRFAAWPRTNSKTKAGIGYLNFAAGDQEYLFFFHSIANSQLTTSPCYGTRALDTTGLTTAEQAALQ